MEPAKEYILYNETTNQYLTHVTFTGSTIYKTTTLDLALHFSEADKQALEQLGVGNSGKILDTTKRQRSGMTVR